jgi:flagellar M-ring protein FliF
MINGIMAENDQGDEEYQARTQEEMDKYLQIVQSAVGYNQERGDQIKVENIQFDRTVEQQRLADLEREKNIDLAFQAGKYILGLVFVILFYTRAIKPIITWITTTVDVEKVEEEEESQEGMTDAQKAEEEELKRLEEGLASASEMRRSVTDFIEKDPKYTAGVMRKWLREKASTSQA